ncbi:MAG TPA: tRNA preQ1(34) S-adenosylmethionine ribosyltransferase-isomerase QueA [Thermodesulfobacteriota bacterium]|nr:tRNA preQ1(34) S-adenosylmethionine ribosyltransferase-isomerase QueA [Thermodesulfobacteriota bacterium]
MVSDLREFDFEVPPALIAQRPAEPRDAARLLVLDRDSGARLHRRVADLPALLAPGDCLVVNDAKVIPARLRGRRPTGGTVELLLVRPRPDLPAPADSPAGDDDPAVWEALARPARSLAPGQRLLFAPPLAAEVLAHAGEGTVVVAFRGGSVREAMERQGEVPLPPYIRRRPGEAGPQGPDRHWYQTVYAAREGAVAAPTAGLHFTPRLLAALEAAGVRIVRLTLWVGPGTFAPVRGDDYRAHRMAAERYEVTPQAAAAINAARGAGGRVVAVGTTVTRTLETVADEAGRVRPGTGETELYITPGFRFRAIDALMTNFHQPRSTPLLLAAAFAGRERLLAAYEEAIRLGYRLFSYGDAMLIR